MIKQSFDKILLAIGLLMWSLPAGAGLFEDAVEGKEEYLDSEKYEIRQWDWNRKGNIRSVVARVNRVRRQNPSLQSIRNIRLCHVDNEAILCYGKASEDGSNRTVTVVSIDPHHKQSGWITLPLHEMGIEPRQPFLAHDLYASYRRSGTFLCYYRHTCSENHYEHVGFQDMTAHVNFSALIDQGESVGFHQTGFVPQYQFLLSLGFLDEIEREQKKNHTQDGSLLERLTMKHLILPDGGMGDTFKVLIQHKGIKQVTLTGLQPL